MNTTFDQIVTIAENSPIWNEGKELMRWAKENASDEDKASFVEWYGEGQDLDQLGNQADTNDWFLGAPSWDEIRANLN